MKTICLLLTMIFLLTGCQVTEEGQELTLQTQEQLNVENPIKTLKEEFEKTEELETNAENETETENEATTQGFVPFGSKDLIFYTNEGEAFATLQKNTEIIISTEASGFFKYPDHTEIVSKEKALQTARDVGIVNGYWELLEKYGAEEGCAVWELYDDQGNQTLITYSNGMPEGTTSMENCYLYIAFGKNGDAWYSVDAEELTKVLQGEATLAEETEIVTFCVSMDEVGMISMLYVLYTTVGELVF